MNFKNNKVYQRVGAATVLCVVAALIYLLCPVSESRWKKASVVVEVRYAYALSCLGDTLYFCDAAPQTGFRNESFRLEDCYRSRMGIGYFCSPWGSISAQTSLLKQPYPHDYLPDHVQEMARTSLERVEQQQQALIHELKEMDYYDSTHFKDDDGWLEMKDLRVKRVEEQARLDSLSAFLKKVVEQPSAAAVDYIYKVNAYYPGHLEEPMPCSLGSIWGNRWWISLQGSMPSEGSSVVNLLFGTEKMRVNLEEVPEDTLTRFAGMLTLPDGSEYSGMITGRVPDGKGCWMMKNGDEYHGDWQEGQRSGVGEWKTLDGRYLQGEWEEDVMLSGRVYYTDGSRYEGALLNDSIPDGAGDKYFTDGSVYWGTWEKGVREGFGMYVGPDGPAWAGTWQENVYQGERLLYTEDRVYGIDMARYQHMNRRRRPANVAWKYLRITSLGKYSRKRIKEETVDYPISFVYLKCTEGVTVLNQFYKGDDQQVRNLGLHVGAYHFFQGTPAEEQLEWFLKHLHYEKGDLPPVLDIEPTNAQILQKWGSDEKMFKEMRIWLKGVEKALGVKPILYVNQSFINNHLSKAGEEFQTYDLWVARYGEFKPYSHMLYWQLSPDGKVSGIQNDVDINVFNGSKERFEEYIQSLQ